jgi:hypothetical protein
MIFNDNKLVYFFFPAKIRELIRKTKEING